MIKKIVREIKNEKVVLFGIVLFLMIGFAVRLYKIDSPIADWHSWRQVDTASVARIFVDHGYDILRPRYYDISSVQTGYFNQNGYRFVEFPIYNVAHAAAYQLFPGISFDVWGRLLSILSAVITGYVLFLIGRRYASTLTGFFACFFYLFLPFNIYFTRVILPEPMATMFAILSIWLFSKFIDSGKNRLLFASAAAFSFAILIKPFAGFYALPIIYLAIKKFGIRNLFTNIPLLIALDIALVPLFAWRAWMGQLEFFVGIPHFKWAFNGDGIRFRPAFWRWIFGERLGSLILGMWGLIPFAFGLHSNDKKRNWILELMLLGMLGYVVIVATASVRHDYYQTIAIPAIALILGRGAAEMLKSKTTAILLLFSTGMMFGMSGYSVREFYKVNHPEFVSVGNIVHETIPLDAKIIAPDNGNTVFLYYTRRQGWPILEESIETVRDTKGADYYVSVNKNDADTSRFKQMFETVKEGDNFILLDLHKPKTP